MRRDECRLLNPSSARAVFRDRPYSHTLFFIPPSQYLCSASTRAPGCGGGLVELGSHPQAPEWNLTSKHARVIPRSPNPQARVLAHRSQLPPWLPLLRPFSWTSAGPVRV